MNASHILSAVERWATGSYMMIPETSLALPDRGRIDGLLVPISGEAHCMKKLRGDFFARVRLVGVEVKASRADFLAGVRKKQYERYRSQLCGLYLATPKGVIAKQEIPENVGHIVVHRKPMTFFKGRGTYPPFGYHATCVRHPAYREQKFAADVPWRIVFAVRDQLTTRHRAEQHQLSKKMSRVGEEASAKVFRVLKKLEQSIDERDGDE